MGGYYRFWLRLTSQVVGQPFISNQSRHFYNALLLTKLQNLFFRWIVHLICILHKIYCQHLYPYKSFFKCHLSIRQKTFAFRREIFACYSRCVVNSQVSPFFPALHYLLHKNIAWTVRYYIFWHKSKWRQNYLLWVGLLRSYLHNLYVLLLFPKKTWPDPTTCADF